MIATRHRRPLTPPTSHSLVAYWPAAAEGPAPRESADLAVLLGYKLAGDADRGAAGGASGEPERVPGRPRRLRTSWPGPPGSGRRGSGWEAEARGPRSRCGDPQRQRSRFPKPAPDRRRPFARAPGSSQVATFSPSPDGAPLRWSQPREVPSRPPSSRPHPRSFPPFIHEDLLNAHA